MRERRSTSWLLGVLLSVTATAAAAQTVVTAPKNKYTPAQDVELGRQAAAQAEKELTILRDPQTTAFIERIGRHLADAAPDRLRHPEFRYTFKVVDAKEINAFALPGGPTYFNRGMFLAAHSEGEVAGVLAHELSHVLLRHGTAQATKATPYEIGTIAGQILGAVVGGRTGAVIAQGSQLGIGVAFLRFSREYERDADLLGAQLMARAGYDPREMANMFRTIAEQDGGSGAPEFLNSHPDPGNRYDNVMREAALLHVQGPLARNDDFNTVRQRLGSEAPAGAERGAIAGGAVAAPSTRYRDYDMTGAFRVSVPDNWRYVPGQNGATFAPDNAFYEGGFTHGVEIGVARSERRALNQATDELIAAFRRANPGLRSLQQRPVKVDGRKALETAFFNQDQHGPELVRITTTLSSVETLLYVVTVVPQAEDADYRAAFARVLRSLRPLR